MLLNLYGLGSKKEDSLLLCYLARAERSDGVAQTVACRPSHVIVQYRRPAALYEVEASHRPQHLSRMDRSCLRI